MSSDEEDDVKLYSALERNRKRQRELVTLSSSSESEGDDDDEVDAFEDRHSAGSFASPMRKRLRNGASPSPAKRSANNTVVLVDEEEKEEYVDDLLTPAERAREQERGRRLDREIAEKIAKDKLLSQTRAVMNMARFQIASEPSSSAIIALDDDDDDDDFAIVPPPRPANGAPSPTGAAALATSTVGGGVGANDKGERMMLQVRSNGTKTEEVIMHSKEPFSVLYDRFCGLHGLPRAAVQMSLDGEGLNLADTPHNNDLESGDLIDAKVDFSKANAENRKQLVRLLLVVEGGKTEKFRIDVSSTMEKLHSSFCKRHQITDPDDVEMTYRGEPVRLRDTVEAHDIFDDDEIKVVIKNFVDPTAIELSVRYDAKTTRTHLIVPTHKVASLVALVATDLSVDVSRISLVLDGDDMHPNQSFQIYDLEGGELIDVKLRP